ncbi:putative tyrosine-protein kinase [Phytophthora citrophthora]|uniref:Tyrosine-protein kinase n=1 Tax=Phytophthora citrophthora TaxID=4793 RepID=A0AAD9LC52_9STRA|nr:putative tyrosine-protein kinase [Phytophthora citrophthora]
MKRAVVTMCCSSTPVVKTPPSSASTLKLALSTRCSILAQMRLKEFLLVMCVVCLAKGVIATTYEIDAFYSEPKCDGTPYVVLVESNSSCVGQCLKDYSTDASTNLGGLSITCSTDYLTDIQDLFGDSPYILREVYRDINCEYFDYALIYHASGNCEGTPSALGYMITTLEDDGSGSITKYNYPLCRASGLNVTTPIPAASLKYHTCDSDKNRWYSSNDNNEVATPTPTSTRRRTPSSGISTGAIVGMIGGGIVLILVIALVIFCCKRKRSTQKSNDTELLPTASLRSTQPGGAFMPSAPSNHTTGMWDDEVIIANRIPRDKIVIKARINHGAFGEVYSGQFNGQLVAVKMLLPASRGNLRLVNQFLTEAKMTATMDHPNVVSFVGVAWDALSDICVVLEFMDGGDLRELLDQYETKHEPVGFNRQKVSIALQVCHALAYLHSLMPPVVHRDLKSRNILLNRSMGAKLTDFGISKERLDQTLTAGVGTSLWMAPEVMLGEWYDDKADIFSFGVVLSELDVHTLPYANTKRNSRDQYGRQLPDAALLQQVASGKVQVEFSSANPLSIIQLGYACVAIDPSLRPSAAEVLYRLQSILAKEL